MESELTVIWRKTWSVGLYRGRLIFTPAQNHQIVEKTRFFDVISTNMIPYGFLLGLGTVPIRNRAVNDERNHRVSYLPKYRQKRWIFNEFRLKNWLHRTRADTESQVLRWWSKQYNNRWKTSKNDLHYDFSNFGPIWWVQDRFFHILLWIFVIFDNFRQRFRPFLDRLRLLVKKIWQKCQNMGSK